MKPARRSRARQDPPIPARREEPIIWRRLDSPGHDWARLSGPKSAPVLRGTSVFLEDGIPGRLDYRIRCDAGWETRGADVLGWVGDRKVTLSIGRSAAGSWTLNGRPVPEVEGCTDLDLSFTPATNLLAIRRLALGIGEEGEARAAWLVFPGLDLRPLAQRFRRSGGNSYSYRSDNGFATELKVDGRGFVVDYPPLWTLARPAGLVSSGRSGMDPAFGA
jgi:uncharacterized protein